MGGREGGAISSPPCAIHVKDSRTTAIVLWEVQELLPVYSLEIPWAERGQKAGRAMADYSSASTIEEGKIHCASHSVSII